MILDNVTLIDFGLYAGRQSIALTPPAPDRPIILFGGLNGGGKTTLLDALQLCLFGPRAKTAGRGKLAYREYLLRCVHERSEHGSAAIEMDFRHTTDGEEDRYTLRRSWRLADDGVREEFRVVKNEQPAPALAEDWAHKVEELFPSNIAHLFLFDGEQIERYAVPAYSGTLVGAAVQNLLGLDIVDQLAQDMRVFERRKRKERMDDEVRERLETAEQEFESLRQQADGIRQERASLKNVRERRARELAVADEAYRGLGGELFERQETIERELASARTAFAASEEGLRELAAGALPLAVAGELLAAVADRDRTDQAIGRARQVEVLLDERDAATLAHLEGSVADTRMLAALRRYLEKDRASHAERAEQRTVLDLTEEGRSTLSTLVQGQLEQVMRLAAESVARHVQHKARLAEVEALNASVPDADAVAEAQFKRASLKAELVRLEAEEAALANTAERLERGIKRAEGTLVRMLEGEARNRGRLDDRERVLASAVRIRGTLTAFRAEIVKRHISSIEHLVLESYQQLLRKTSLVTRLTIHPESFSVRLYGATGDEVRAEALSAGERQLLGIALLWGLRRASGRPLPTAIDTPLGRLDTGHRQHFVERYLPFASHQTLVFSTDEEIVGGYLESLGPWIGRSYYLSYNDASGSTRVEPGYFKGERFGGH